MCVVFNYSTGQWMFWQFNDISGVAMYLVAQGEYIKTYMPTWDDLLFTPSGTTVSGTKDITVSSATGLQIGMRVIGTGVDDISYITAIAGDVISVDKNTTASATVNLTIGFTWEYMDMRWSDLIVNENFARMIFGDSNGYLYEYSQDNTTDSGFAITSALTTKDYPLNKLESDFKLLETVLQLRLKESATGYYSPATLTIRASVDAGRNWTAWQTVTLDGNESYQEKKVNWNMVGKHCRFEIAFSNPLIIETLRIGFNAQYKSMKFDN